MRQIALFFFVLIFSVFSAPAQTRYFQFRVECGHGKWQDTAFIAAASDEALISEALAEMQKPVEQRRFINGPIDYGDGGYNHNGSHRFLWHFIPDQWHFANFAAEVCDGCPYSDVDADTAYWVRKLGYFCSWSARPVREIFLSGIEDGAPDEPYIFYDRQQKKIFLKNFSGEYSLRIFNLLGVEENFSFESAETGISGLSAGVYFARFQLEKKIFTQKILIE